MCVYGGEKGHGGLDTRTYVRVIIDKSHMYVRTYVCV